MSIEKICSALKKYNSFLLTAHVNLEGDALGSELALASLLRKLGKKVYVINNDRVPSSYKFLPGIKNIRPKISADMDFEAVIFLDCSDENRAGGLVNSLPEDSIILNIDHHISNTNFGHLNWVDPNSSSACEMVFKLFKFLKVPISKKEALQLYVGILTDTGSFRYQNTTAETHLIVSELLKFGIGVNKIYQRLYESHPFSDALFLNKIFSTLRNYRKGKIAWMEITEDMLLSKRSKTDQTENILDFARSIKGPEVVLLFKQVPQKNDTRVNFRSRGKIDVNKIASFFGGGGHKNASGCTINMSLEKAKEAVLARLDKEFNRLKL